MPGRRRPVRPARGSQAASEAFSSGASLTAVAAAAGAAILHLIPHLLPLLPPRERPQADGAEFGRQVGFGGFPHLTGPPGGEAAVETDYWSGDPEIGGTDRTSPSRGHFVRRLHVKHLPRRRSRFLVRGGGSGERRGERRGSTEVAGAAPLALRGSMRQLKRQWLCTVHDAVDGNKPLHGMLRHVETAGVTCQVRHPGFRVGPVKWASDH